MGGDARLTGYRSASSAGVTRLSIRAVGVRQFCSLQVSEICCFYGRTPGSDAHHDKPIAADFKCEVFTPRRVVSMITKKQANALVLSTFDG